MRSKWLMGGAILLALGTPSLAQSQSTVCRKCKEVIDSTASPWQYYHLFDSSGGVMRECVPTHGFLKTTPVAMLEEDDSSSCHNDEAANSCSSHSNCSGEGSLAATIEKLDALAQAVQKQSSQAAARELFGLVEASRNITLVANRGLVRVADCQGKIAAEWYLPNLYRSTFKSKNPIELSAHRRAIRGPGTRQAADRRRAGA
jgi:hypothetical protein